MSDSGMPNAVSPLLATKLYARVSLASLVPRQRLIEVLSSNPVARLILVSAPAGFGKTTALAEWLSERSGRFAWLSLDSGDNDPTTFLRYVVAAFRTLGPELCPSTHALLESAQPPPVDLALRALVNDLGSLSGIGAGLALILDDYHVISSQEVHAAVGFLLDNLPPSVQLVIASRADPPLPLSRLRVRGQLLEVRAEALRFTSEEATTFFRAVMRLDLTVDQVQALAERTEGWIAGLQLAGLSLQGRQDVARLVQAFSGSHRYVLDFLVEEVLAREPEVVQSFLLETSILERLTGGLCEAVTEKLAGQTMLEHLERSNLFLVPLDDERCWYRYHHLFRDLLRARLDQADPDAVPTLCSRAANWCDAQGLSSEAIGYALAARDYEQAAEIAERQYLDLLSRSDLALARVAELPDEVLRRRPWLSAFRGVLDIVFARLAEAKRWLSDAVGSDGPESGQGIASPDLAAFLRLERAYIVDLDTGEPKPSEADVVGAAEEVLWLLPESLVALRNVVAYWAAMSHYLKGDLETAYDRWERVVLGDLRTGATNAIGVTVDKLATIRRVQGRLGEAADLCREWLRRMDERGRWRYYLAGGVWANLADVLRERGELAEALQLVDQGIGDDLAWQNANSWAFAYPIKANVLLGMGRSEEAGELLRELDERLRGHVVQPDVRCEIAACWVRLHVGRREVSEAASRIDEILAGSSGAPSFRFERAWISRARVLLAQGEPSKAAELLSRLAAEARRGGRVGRLIEVLGLEALALELQGQATKALDSLGQALSLAELEGHLRVFVDEGEPMLQLLSRLRPGLAGQSGVSAAYHGRLVAAFGVGVATASAGGSGPTSGDGRAVGRVASDGRSAAPLVEPLSDRELEVLRMLAEGLSNQQIARELVVAPGTVKAHVHNICGKLGAANRSHAAALARKLGLL